MKHSNLTFSIVIPVYNKEAFIAEAIQSILDQTVQDFEIILIDDASNDSSTDICTFFSREYDHVHYYRNDKNMGIGFSRNRGNRIAKGEWIVVQDADDISYPDRLEKFVSFLERNPTTDMYYTAIDVADDKLNIYDHWPAKEVTAFALRNGDQVVPHATCIYKRDLIIETPYLDSQRVNDDYPLIVEWWNKGYVFKPNTTPTTLYRVLPSGVSSQNFQRIQKELPIWEKLVQDR